MTQPSSSADLSSLKDNSVLIQATSKIVEAVQFRKWKEMDTPGSETKLCSQILSTFLFLSSRNPFGALEDILEDALIQNNIHPESPLDAWKRSGEDRAEIILEMLLENLKEEKNEAIHAYVENNKEKTKEYIEKQIIATMEEKDKSTPSSIFTSEKTACLVCIPGKADNSTNKMSKKECLIKTDGENNFIPTEQFIRTTRAFGLAADDCKRISEFFTIPEESEDEKESLRTPPILNMTDFCSLADGIYDESFLVIIYCLVKMKDALKIHKARKITLSNPVIAAFSEETGMLHNESPEKNSLPLCLPAETTAFLSGTDFKIDPSEKTGMNPSDYLSEIYT